MRTSFFNLYLLAVLLSYSNLSSAYLDPGTGNALIYLILSAFGAGVFYLKRIFYKFIGLLRKENSGSSKNVIEITIFSEGKTYWFTFKPIIEELLSRKINFRYLSTDIEDPALTISSPFMHSRYVGEGQKAYAKIGRSEGKVFLSTTPNIGCKGYPLRRPKRVDKMVHIYHSVNDLSYYKQGSLDNYDVVIDIGKWCEPRLREVEKIRHLKPKKWLAAGLPYLDELSKNVVLKKDVSNPICVLVAPSWGDKNSLKVHGTDFLFRLLNNNFSVILRPHPQSWHFEKEFYDSLLLECNNFENFNLDTKVDGRFSMEKSDILISDSSSFRFDFAFLYKKPVITLQVPTSDLSSYEAALLGGPWEKNIVHKLGTVIKKGESIDICNVIRNLVLNNRKETIDVINNLYDEIIVNHGRSAQVIVDYIVNEGLN